MRSHVYNQPDIYVTVPRPLMSRTLSTVFQPVTTTVLYSVLRSSCSWLHDYPFRQFWHTWRYSALSAESAGLDPRVDFSLCVSLLFLSLFFSLPTAEQNVRWTDHRRTATMTSLTGSTAMVPSSTPTNRLRHTMNPV